ncbi:Hypothetical_protein [Hexamita inflata]|uniref:Hypothetical_protein n=1 Tax=Hexamita inflata TaxID=28002 RepID=A0AA86PFJ6_9EUKA|nr:Hypothetical protein HINF_LOCUS25348 [Hexamita inflata]
MLLAAARPGAEIRPERQEVQKCIHARNQCTHSNRGNALKSLSEPSEGPLHNTHRRYFWSHIAHFEDTFLKEQKLSGWPVMLFFIISGSVATFSDRSCNTTRPTVIQRQTCDVYFMYYLKC